MWVEYSMVPENRILYWLQIGVTQMIQLGLYVLKVSIEFVSCIINDWIAKVGKNSNKKRCCVIYIYVDITQLFVS